MIAVSTREQLIINLALFQNTSLSYHTSYQKKELLEIVEQLNIVVQKAPKRKLKTIYDKYSHENFFKVSALNLKSSKSN